MRRLLRRPTVWCVQKSGSALKRRYDVPEGTHDDTWRVGGMGYYLAFKKFVQEAVAFHDGTLRSRGEGNLSAVSETPQCLPEEGAASITRQRRARQKQT